MHLAGIFSHIWFLQPMTIIHRLFNDHASITPLIIHWIFIDVIDIID